VGAQATRPRASRSPGPVGNITRLAFGIVEGSAPEEVAARDAALRRLLVMADVLAASVALLICVDLLGGDRLRPASLAILPLVVVASRLMGLYDRDEMVLAKTTLNEVPALFHLATLYAFVVYVGQEALVDGGMGANQAVGLWAAFLVCGVTIRSLIRRLGVMFATPERCLVVANRPDVERVSEKLRHGWALNAEVVAAIDPADLRPEPDARAGLATLVREHHVHRIILVTAVFDNERFLEIVRDMKALGVKVSVKPRFLDVVGTAVEFEDVHGDAFLGVRRFGLSRAERRTKRTMDLVGSALLLLATAPLFLLCAIAIKLGGGGPVFFGQERVGRGGRRFRIWKFRTMSVDAEDRKAGLLEHNEAGAGLFKLTDDPRVTRAGRFLRRTSLDELPQLVNVLRGEMSLVGPRPLVVDEDEQIEGWHRRRLHLTPGMTGMWQILGSARIPMHEMVALDYLYIVNWSLWNDLQILIRTAGFVLGRRGI
jgi:exopolysaccharide biosynthesis polyprenyl glycosylphosphotransferase